MVLGRPGWTPVYCYAVSDSMAWEQCNWCFENAGENNVDWAYISYFVPEISSGVHEYAFLDVHHAVAFKLAFSENVIPDYKDRDD